MAIDSGEGRDDFNILQFSLSYAHSSHILQLSMNKRKALSKPERKASLSIFDTAPHEAGLDIRACLG